jgi:low affinity Fe/Cu permease
MSQSSPPSVRDRFNHVASTITLAAGSPAALIAASSLIVLWAVSGPVFQFSETWQLVINTGTTIITFLMVFVIQASQNRDSKALHLKLDEVIRSIDGARNQFIGAEQSTEEEIREREEEFLRIAEHGGVVAAATARRGRTPGEAARKAASSAPVRKAARAAAERQVRKAGAAGRKTSASRRNTST